MAKNNNLICNYFGSIVFFFALFCYLANIGSYRNANSAARAAAKATQKGIVEIT